MFVKEVGDKDGGPGREVMSDQMFVKEVGDRDGGPGREFIYV